MKAGRFMTEETLLKEAVSVLMKTLGPVETCRFLAMPGSKRMESVRRHRRWQIQLNKNAFFDKVFKT